MFDILKSYMKDTNSYILITDDYLYIKNYTKIIGISETEVTIKINEKIIKIDGKNMSLTECENGEVKIRGVIESIKKYDN